MPVVFLLKKKGRGDMRNLLTGGQMKAVDSTTIENIGIPSLVLMERAAFGVAQEVINYAKKTDQIWAVCGSGNNGADGIAAVRMLHLKGYQAFVLLAGNKKKGSKEYLSQISIAENIGVPILEYSNFKLEKCDLLIDALFGVGLDREIQGTYGNVLRAAIACQPRLTVAVDIPSGIHADTGQIMGIALKADVTVTFGYEKLGTMLYPGKEFSGNVLVYDIGLSTEGLKQRKTEYFTLEQGDETMIPMRPAYSNKGDFGKVLVVAGSLHMSGAAYLSALAAYRTGAGLVKILTVEDNRIILQTGLPEAIITAYHPEDAGNETEEFIQLVKKQCEWASVIVLGPGLGQEAYVKNLVDCVLTHADVPLILDADGLNAVALNPKLTSRFYENVIITPHLGEMARLTGNSVETIKKHLLAAAREYADQYGITCVLKDAVTIGALKDHRVYINSSGNSAMAKAGSGDVLTGIIAGLIALGMEPCQAVPLGIWLHGRAGDMGKEAYGDHSLLARDIIEEVHTILQER